LRSEKKKIRTYETVVWSGIRGGKKTKLSYVI